MSLLRASPRRTERLQHSTALHYLRRVRIVRCSLPVASTATKRMHRENVTTIALPPRRGRLAPPQLTPHVGPRKTPRCQQHGMLPSHATAMHNGPSATSFVARRQCATHAANAIPPRRIRTVTLCMPSTAASLLALPAPSSMARPKSNRWQSRGGLPPATSAKRGASLRGGAAAGEMMWAARRLAQAQPRLHACACRAEQAASRAYVEAALGASSIG